MYTTESLYEVFLQSTGVSTDTRQNLDGKLFFALRGERFDGNTYARSALAAGALAAVVDDPGLKDVSGCYYVRNSLTTLQRLAHFHRNHFQIPLVAITGTNGKTTTKELIVSVLSEKYRLCATQGNLNNHIGVPLTLLQIRAETEVAVIEMGANHPGEIGWLCQIAAPNIGLVTNVGRAHLEGFGSVDKIWNTKMDLYRYLDAKAGLLLINREEKSLAPLDEIFFERVFRFDRAHLKSPSVTVDFESTEEHIEVTMQNELGSYAASVGLYGEHNINNILCAIAVGTQLALTPTQITEGLKKYRSKLNRSEIVKKGTNTFYLDAYNANPTSMKLALQFFDRVKAARKVVILGDMFELGEEAGKLHQEVMDQVGQMQLNELLLVGEHFGKCIAEGPEYLIRRFSGTELLKDYFQKADYHDTCFLIKGSRSMKLEILLQ